MPTSKRKVNRKRWKQPKITGKRFNGRLGFNPGARSELANPPFLPLVFPSTSLRINLPTRQPVYSPTWLLTYLPTRLHVYPPTKLPIYLPTHFVRFSARILTQRLPILSINAPPHRKNSILARVCFGAERGTAYTCRQGIRSGINMQTLPN